MSNASLKEQLQAVASKLSDDVNKQQKIKKAFHQAEKNSRQHTKNIKPNKPKPKWLDYVQYGVELLKVYFPQSFRSANDVKPLRKALNKI